MKNKSLSDKIEYYGTHKGLIELEDVKQFIKDLKKGMYLTIDNANVIDKLAGEELTNGK